MLPPDDYFSLDLYHSWQLLSEWNPLRCTARTTTSNFVTWVSLLLQLFVIYPIKDHFFVVINIIIDYHDHVYSALIRRRGKRNPTNACIDLIAMSDN